jgi:tetratricopeptide (TPR) repeat protein
MSDSSLGVDAPSPRRNRLDSSLNIILLVALVAVIGIAAIFGYSIWQDRQQRAQATPALRTINELEGQSRKAPGNVPLHVRLGEAYAAAGMGAKATQQLKIATKLDPKHTGAWLDLGMIAMNEKKYPEAKGYFTKVVDLTAGADFQNVNNRRESALYGLGMIALESKQYEEAVGRFKEALRIRDDASDTYYHLALAYRGMDEDDAAIDQLQLALAFDPSFGAGNYLLGQIYLDRKDFVNASYHMRTASVSAPDSEQVKTALDTIGPASSWYDKSQSQMKAGDLDQAVESVLVARNLDPENADYAKAHAKILVLRKDTTDALDVYLQAARMDPKDAKVQSEIKRLTPLVPKAAALEVYLKAAGQDTQNKVLRAQVDRLTKALPKATAIKIYQKVGKTDSQNPVVLAGLAKLQGKK